MVHDGLLAEQHLGEEALHHGAARHIQQHVGQPLQGGWGSGWSGVWRPASIAPKACTDQVRPCISKCSATLSRA